MNFPIERSLNELRYFGLVSTNPDIYTRDYGKTKTYQNRSETVRNAKNYHD